jgi:hypothetical protein
MEQQDKMGRRVLRLDGSNERFTLESMSDWLDRNIVGTNPVMLIVDEFHRLPRDMKEQLLRWCGCRRFIKLVMIANRWVVVIAGVVVALKLLPRLVVGTAGVAHTSSAWKLPGVLRWVCTRAGCHGKGVETPCGAKDST